ncbi:kinase-like domain-containing protein [Aspergillus insuetus]
MSPLSDLVQDSLLATTFPGIGTAETVHVYHERSLQARRQVARSERWIRRGRIGQGGFASVWREERADQCDNGGEKPVMRAVKEINLKGRAGRVDYTRELEAIAKFSQRKYDQVGCFVKTYGWYKTAKSLFIAMEYLELGDLQTYLHRDEQPPLPECEAQDIVYQILYGLREMHENDFVHRDLKLGNILIESCPPNNWWVKLADFGISKRIGDGQDMPTTTKGTPGYMAPELQGLIKRGEPYPIDIWAVGEITFQLLTKTPVFPHAGALVKYMANTNDFPLMPLVKAGASFDSATFILALMRQVPQDRTSAAEALEHIWITQTLPIPPQSASRAYSSPYTRASVEAMTEEFASWNTVTTAKTSNTLIQRKPDSSSMFAHYRPAQARSDNVRGSVPPPPSIPRIKLPPQISPTPTPPPPYPINEPPMLPDYKQRKDYAMLPTLGVKPSRLKQSPRFSLSDTEQKKSTPPPRSIPSSRSYQDLSSVKEPSRRAQPPPLPPRKANVDSQGASRKYHGISSDIAALKKSPLWLPKNMSQKTQSASIDPLSFKVPGLEQSNLIRDLASPATPPESRVDTPQELSSSIMNPIAMFRGLGAAKQPYAPERFVSSLATPPEATVDTPQKPSPRIARNIAESKRSSPAKEPYNAKRTTESLATPSENSDDIAQTNAFLISHNLVLDESGRLRVADYLGNDSISSVIASFRTQRLSDSQSKETSATKQGSPISEIPSQYFEQPSLSSTIATSGKPPAPSGNGSEPEETARMVFPGSGDEFWAGRTLKQMAEAILDASAAYPDSTDQAMKRLEENLRNKPR